jgi:TolB-like protein
MRSLFLALALMLVAPGLLPSESIAARPVITVLDFKGSGVSQAEIEVFVDYLTAKIVVTNAYRVIDRAQREVLLQEQQFSVSDCSDEKCLLQVGKLLAANQIVVGSIGKVGTRFLLNLKLVEVETGETVRTASQKYDSLDALIDDSDRLAKEFVAGGTGAEVAGSEPTHSASVPKAEEPKAEEPKTSPAANQPSAAC